MTEASFSGGNFYVVADVHYSLHVLFDIVPEWLHIFQMMEYTCLFTLMGKSIIFGM